MINSRNTDPITSHMAGDYVESTGIASNQRLIVSKAVADFPGMTSKELADAAGIDRFMVARRLPEIVSVKRGEARECRIGKRQSLTWWPA